MNSVSCWCFVFKYYSCLDTCKLGQHCRRLRLQFIRYLLWQKMITGRIWISEWVIQWTYLHKPTWPRIWGYTLPHPHIYTNKEIKGWIKAKEKERERDTDRDMRRKKMNMQCNVMKTQCGLQRDFKSNIQPSFARISRISSIQCKQKECGCRVCPCHSEQYFMIAFWVISIYICDLAK